MSLLETSIFFNDGKGNFIRGTLPIEVQLSPVYAADVNDYNGDAKLDILLGGNLYNVKPEVGRYDASFGSFLSGNGSGAFSYIPPKSTGMKLEGEIRDIIEIETISGKILVIASCNDQLQVFKVLNN